jgi:hypothetical protein
VRLNLPAPMLVLVVVSGYEWVPGLVDLGALDHAVAQCCDSATLHACAGVLPHVWHAMSPG